MEGYLTVSINDTNTITTNSKEEKEEEEEKEKKEWLNRKEKGNQYFKEKKYKEAAIEYSKALKLQNINNYILWSNRSIAFLKIERLSSALQDAEKCIQLNPTWSKGYYRKASVLERMGKINEMLLTLSKGLELEPNSIDMLNMKMKYQSQQVQQHIENKDDENFILKEDISLFIQQIFKEIENELYKRKKLTNEKIFFRSSCYLLPKEEEKEQIVISILEAFSSPQTYLACFEYLKEIIKKENYKVSLIVVQKSTISYPQIWKNKTKEQWVFDENQDGLFFQLEVGISLKLLHFFPICNNTGEIQKNPFVLNTNLFFFSPSLFY